MQENFLIQIEGTFGNCKLCGKSGPLLPFGENKTMICFECGQTPKNQKRAKKIIGLLIDKMLQQETVLISPAQQN